MLNRNILHIFIQAKAASLRTVILIVNAVALPWTPSEPLIFLVTVPKWKNTANLIVSKLFLVYRIDFSTVGWDLFLHHMCLWCG